ncbi:MAG TPA: hypothetical protein VGO15_09010 [Candidatus Limnocylindrales bacterium]|nr:hypothetical protein [Candidatus Limnocylindrales bacterium]
MQSRTEVIDPEFALTDPARVMDRTTATVDPMARARRTAASLVDMK